MSSTESINEKSSWEVLGPTSKKTVTNSPDAVRIHNEFGGEPKPKGAEQKGWSNKAALAVALALSIGRNMNMEQDIGILKKAVKKLRERVKVLESSSDEDDSESNTDDDEVDDDDAGALALDSGSKMRLEKEISSLKKAIKKLAERVDDWTEDETEDDNAVANPGVTNMNTPQQTQNTQIPQKKELFGEEFAWGIFCGVLFFFLCSFVLSKIKAGDINEMLILFSEKDHKGSMLTIPPWTLNSNKCYNLNKYQSGFASSIDTQGECVWIFKESDCRGKNAQIGSWTKEHGDLGHWDLDKNIWSIQTCSKHR